MEVNRAQDVDARRRVMQLVNPAPKKIEAMFGAMHPMFGKGIGQDTDDGAARDTQTGAVDQSVLAHPVDGKQRR